MEMRKFAFACALMFPSTTALSGVAQAQAATAAPFTTADTTIGELLDNPQTKAILEKYLPDVANSDQIDMARGMTLTAIQAYAADTVTDEKLKAIDAELAALPAK
jgi:hypothetical protein